MKRAPVFIDLFNTRPYALLYTQAKITASVVIKDPKLPRITVSALNASILAAFL